MKLVNFEDKTATYLKALVYGNSGTGKTTFGASAPRPLILLSEKQAVVNIRDAARRMGRPVPTTMIVDTIDDFRLVIKALHGDRSKPFVIVDDAGTVLLTMDPWPETVVLDSVTDVAEMVSREIRLQSPQKDGKDGLPVDSERYWNVLSDRTAKLIRAFRDVPLHVLFLALLADKELGGKDDDVKVRWVGPQMPMKSLPQVLMAAVNVVGVTYRVRSKVIDPVTKSREMVYGIATMGPDYTQLKPYRPLRDQEVTDFASWVARIQGIEDGSVAPPSMEADDAFTAPSVTAAATPEPQQPAAGAPEAPAAAEPPAARPKAAKAKPDAAAAKPDPIPTANA